MTTQLRIEDVPLISDGRRRRRSTVASKAIDGAFRAAARGMGQGPVGSTVVATTAVTSALLQLLPAQLFPTRSLTASAAFPYNTHADCAGFNYNGTCETPCFGFAPHHMDAFYCTTCDEANNVPGNYAFWHFVGSRGSIQYRDMEPDACQGRDAWKWQVGACGSCRESALYRCHDGYKKYPDSATWDPTICEGLVVCDGELNAC